jgi:transcriptional antiterminator RfaH
VRFAPEAGLWRAVNATRGLTRLVQTDPRRPTPLPDALVEGLLARCDAEGRLAAAPELAEGDRVRVIAGPFADLVGRIETLEEGERIRVMLDLMGREVRTRIGAEAVEKLD